MDENSPLPLEYSAGRNRRRPAFLVYALMLLCLGISWCVVSLVHTYHLPRAMVAAKDLTLATGRQPHELTLALFNFAGWWWSGGGLLAAGLGLAACGLGFWIDRKSENPRRVWIYAIIICIVALVLAVLYLMWCLLSADLALPGMLRFLPPPAPASPATTQSAS